MRRVCFAALLVGAFPAFATEPVKYISSGGGLFSYEENRYGAVLTVVDRQAEAMLSDDGISPRLETGDALYLGRACDALSLDFGAGRWIATEGGFIVSVGQEQVLFPGQTIPLRTYADCEGDPTG